VKVDGRSDRTRAITSQIRDDSVSGTSGHFFTLEHTNGISSQPKQ